MALYGYVDADSHAFNTSFGSKFTTYSLSWTGGSGDARIYDPAGQIVGGEHNISNTSFFNQDLDGDKVGGGYSNNLLEIRGNQFYNICCGRAST